MGSAGTHDWKDKEEEGGALSVACKGTQSSLTGVTSAAVQVLRQTLSLGFAGGFAGSARHHIHT